MGITTGHLTNRSGGKIDMALVRWEPAREINSLQQEMNRLFSTFFDAPAPPSSAPRRWVPAMDLVETDDHFVLRADLPGLSEADVDLSLEENVLTLKGERKVEHEAKGEGFYRLERSAGAFSRSLTLPEGVDGDAIAATFDKGVLEVRIPKPEQKKPRRLQITVGDTPAEIEGRAAEQAATS
jgi:HSP20 family protein